MASLPRWSAECVLDARALLGEGPTWWAEANRLLWVDIEAGRVGLFDVETRDNRWLDLGTMVGCVVPTERGDLLVACANGFHRLDPSSGQLTVLHDQELQQPLNRFNDGKCDPWGRFWAGSMALDFTPGAGALWCLEPSLQSRCLVPNLSIANGLAWDLEASCLYLIDSPTLQVVAYPLTPDGELAGPAQSCLQIPSDWNALPDGMTIDQEGMLWVALYGGSAVTRWNPRSGDCIGIVDLPCSQVTSCCFGGPSLDRLFITTARRGLGAEVCAQQPLAGGLFCVDVGVCGSAADRFAG
ncbi:SMP-30/gluconolactonase/LRE family protein [Synechococcus sp. CBW1002]|uniref:SMP-30/gluconolactonase/LRE family protein n=1 Tax=Synechococcus sp. CBW1002 TaxID=1353134 RepID=UPI0018CEDD1A|nr:SMP-30/gluconolactonase/LRE family protein [Synechococcus sp. CBW1002]QPN61183.1 SMP-30/gluconolactonase/LRE family protein [Synechococcus sp. CBW1002]